MKIIFVRNLGQRFKNAMIGNQPQDKLKHGLKILSTKRALKGL